MRYLIIGGGVAGMTAAINIRKLDKEGEITVLTDEPLPFYSRIRLIDYLAAEVDEERLVLYKKDWYEKNRIGLVLDTPVASIDTGKKEVVSSGGERFGFDRLLISTGGASFVPPIKGAALKGVFTLRDIRDARKIREYAEGIGDVVLIGGGLLGIESGNSLRKIGKKVAVVEFFDRLLPRQMDPQGSGILCGQMEDMGFAFYLGAKTKEITGSERVEAVALEDGRSIKAGMVIISAGIRASTKLAEAATAPAGQGINVGKKGIIVDDRMETSVKGIFAAGDAAEHRGVSYGIWPAAEKQGEAAGINMAGGNTLYGGITPSNILKVAGIDLVSAGNIDAEGKCECIVEVDKERHTYRKLVIENDCLSGCIILGAFAGRRKILKAIDDKRNISTIREELKKWNIEGL